MKIIVPMAGRGSRLRPHSLTVPKPLIPVAGQPIVHRLVKDIAKVLKQPIEEIAFVLGDPAWFGDDVVSSLKDLATSLGAKASIYRQDLPLGTGHAIMCAKPSLSGPAVIAYADTLIRAEFDLDPSADSVIWTKQVNNPEAYGVVKLNTKGDIVELVEKPETFVSDQAVIGIYYFKDVAVLKGKLQEILDENIIEPCFIGENVVLKNTTVGPFVSIGKGSIIENSTVKNSLIQTNTIIKNANLDHAMIGNHVKFDGNFTSISIGDYSVLE